MQLHIYLQFIEQYIKHSQSIAANSPAYMRRTEFTIGMKQCAKLLQWIEAYRPRIKDEAIIKQVIRYSDYLWWILPHVKNNSYQTSLKNLMRILQPATAHLKGDKKVIEL